MTRPLEVDIQFDVFLVRKIQDVFVAGGKFRELQGKRWDYTKLMELPLICLEGNTSTRKYVDGFLKERQVEVTPEFELATSDMIVQFALRNLGIGCVVEDFIKKQLDSGELFKLEFETPIPERDMCLIVDKRVTMSVAALRLKELLEQGLQGGREIEE